MKLHRAQCLQHRNHNERNHQNYHFKKHVQKITMHKIHMYLRTYANNRDFKMCILPTVKRLSEIYVTIYAFKNCKVQNKPVTQNIMKKKTIIKTHSSSPKSQKTIGTTTAITRMKWWRLMVIQMF